MGRDRRNELPASDTQLRAVRGAGEPTSDFSASTSAADGGSVGVEGHLASHGRGEHYDDHQHDGQ